MEEGKLKGKRIAVVLESDFEDSEFYVPYEKLEGEGAKIVVIGLERGKELKGKKGGYRTNVEREFSDVDPDEFDALLIPGGYSPDKLRAYPEAIEFVKGFRDKPIAAVCHGPQLLITADMVRGKTMTSWKSISVDLINAGANYIDEQVVVDGNIITSRQPSDLEAFTKAIIEKLVS